NTYYLSFLPKTSTTISSIGNEEPARTFCSYHNVMKGFETRLTASQLKEMEKKPVFVSDTETYDFVLSYYSYSVLSWFATEHGLVEGFQLWERCDHRSYNGVDILSISFGRNPSPFYNDIVTLGAYRPTETHSCGGGIPTSLNEGWSSLNEGWSRRLPLSTCLSHSWNSFTSPCLVANQESSDYE
ncbi:hypothetical protein FXO38_35480, partial [Capsicum annuum]